MFLIINLFTSQTIHAWTFAMELQKWTIYVVYIFYSIQY